MIAEKSPKTPHITRTYAPTGHSPFRTNDLASRHLVMTEIEYGEGEVNIIRAAAKSMGLTLQEFLQEATRQFRRTRRIRLEQPAEPPLPILGTMIPGALGFRYSEVAAVKFEAAGK